MSGDVRDRLAALLPDWAVGETFSKRIVIHEDPSPARDPGVIATALADTLVQAARDKARVAELEAAHGRALALADKWSAVPSGVLRRALDGPEGGKATE